MLKKAETLPNVFLDTSIQVRRILGTIEQRQQIEAILSQQIQTCTSFYVYMEFQRSVIADFAHVHNILQRESDWGSAIAAVVTGHRAFRPRSLVRVNRILGETLNRSHLDREKGLILLSTYLDNRLQRLFWQHVAPLPDTIHCDLVVAGITLQPDTTYSVAAHCRQENAACFLPDFLADQRAKVRMIAEYLAAHPNVIKDQPRVERLLNNVQNDPRSALGQTHCWPLGDIIIALAIPNDCALWTIDADFMPLATALGIRLYTPE